MFFHPELVHGSGINRVPIDAPPSEERESFRAAIALHYVRADLQRFQPSGAPVWAETPVGKAVIDAADAAGKEGGAVAYGGVAYSGPAAASGSDDRPGGGEGGGGGEEGPQRFNMAQMAAEASIADTHKLVRKLRAPP